MGTGLCWKAQLREKSCLQGYTSRVARGIRKGAEKKKMNGEVKSKVGQREHFIPGKELWQ